MILVSISNTKEALITGYIRHIGDGHDILDDNDQLISNITLMI